MIGFCKVVELNWILFPGDFLHWENDDKSWDTMISSPSSPLVSVRKWQFTSLCVEPPMIMESRLCSLTWICDFFLNTDVLKVAINGRNRVISCRFEWLLAIKCSKYRCELESCIAMFPIFIQVKTFFFCEQCKKAPKNRGKKKHRGFDGHLRPKRNPSARCFFSRKIALVA